MATRAKSHIRKSIPRDHPKLLVAMEEQQLSDKQEKLLGTLRSKYFHFNIPNYVASDFLEILPSNLTYVIQGREIAPTTGTPHLQCYVIASGKNIRGTAIKKLFPNARDIQKQYKDGSISASVTYCSKEDPNPHILGVQPQDANPGKRSDLADVGERIRTEKATAKQIANDDFATWARNYKAIDRYIEMQYEVKKYRPDLQVILKYGATGLGKTYDTRQVEYPNCYKKPIGKGLWFDEYAHEREVLIDEFHGQWPLSDILQILDPDTSQVERKGSHVMFDPDVIILCTNMHPSLMYPDRSQMEKDAFFNRLKTVHFYISRNKYIVLSPGQKANFLNDESWVPKDPLSITLKRKPQTSQIVQTAIDNQRRYGGLPTTDPTDNEYYRTVNNPRPSRSRCVECNEFYCECNDMNLIK